MSPANEEDCIAFNSNAPDSEGSYCTGFWEGLLHRSGVCWPHTMVNHSVSVPCPDIFGFDTSDVVTRECNIDGYWVNVTRANFGTCLSDETRRLLENEFGADTAFDDLVVSKFH